MTRTFSLRGVRAILENKPFSLSELHRLIPEDEILLIQEMIQHLIFIFNNGGIINESGLNFDNSSPHITSAEIVVRNVLNKADIGRSKAIYIGPGSISKIHMNKQGKVDMSISGTTYFLGANGFCATKYLFRYFEKVLGRKSTLGPESLMNVLFTEVLCALHTREP